MPPPAGQTQQTAQTGFVPPPPDTWQGPGAIGPQFPQGDPAGNPTLAQTDQAFKSVGRKALDYLPAAGAVAGTMLAPEGAIPAIIGAGLGGMTGETARQGALSATGDPQAPQSFGQAVANVGESGLEQAGMEAGGRAIAKPIEWGLSKVFSPTALYGKTLKTSTTHDPAVAEQRIATGLREGIPTSQQGYSQLKGKIGDITDRMGQIVTTSPNAQAALVNPIDIAQRLDDLIANSPQTGQALNQQSLSALQRYKTEYLTKHGAVFDNAGNMTKPPDLMTSVETLNEKRNTYQAASQAYESAQKGGAPLDTNFDAASKSLARGAKDELIKLYPELEPLGLQDKELLDLQDSIRQFIGRERNRSSFGLRNVMLGAGALGAVASGHYEAGAGAGVLGLALNALDDPEVKSKLAIALYKAGANVPAAAQKYLQYMKTETVPNSIRLGRALLQASQPLPPKPQ